ncbi:hypothetical protein RRF57_002513 [Xylaria bambusicola]|uniref:Uncharacterized protein n=1 Tax=Xylaria bambusicola TaxID=326684 RepID=A0AAN7Z4J9_9PEZI
MKQNGSEPEQNGPDKRHSPPREPLRKRVYNPFQRFMRGDYLQGRPDTDVYRLLSHAYFLRKADSRIYNGDSTDGGQLDFDFKGFREFLNKAKQIPRMLPPWWSDKKQAECEELGGQTRWGSLAYAIRRTDIRQQYREPFMDIQLRLLAEYIHGTGIGDSKHCFLREELTRIHDGRTTNNEMGRIITARWFKRQIEHILATLDTAALAVCIEEAYAGEQ